MKRNRQQRRAATMYKLENIFRSQPSNSPLSEADLEVAPPHYLEGEVDGVVFVSVPMTTSHHSCERLRDMLSMAFKGKQIMIITHNIELLKATKLDPSETATVIRRIEELQGVRNADSPRNRSRNCEAGGNGIEPSDGVSGSDTEVGGSNGDQETGGET